VSPPPSDYPIERVQETAQILKKHGIKHIILLGTPPIYKTLLSKILGNIAKKTKSVPSRIAQGIDREKLETSDENLSKIEKEEKIKFLSIYREMCDTNSCLARTEDKREAIASFNAGHLTPSAAHWLFERIRPRLLDE